VTEAPDRSTALAAASTTLKGSVIVSEGKVVGSVTSSAWSPALGCPVALGYVHRSVLPSNVVELRTPTTDASGSGDDHDAERTGMGFPTRAEVRTLPMV
jgi:glycine cleavage system aminomethyltransferase T